jgi:hypothetical protein
VGETTDRSVEQLHKVIRAGWMVLEAEPGLETAKSVGNAIHGAAVEAARQGHAAEVRLILDRARRPGSEQLDGAWNYLLSKTADSIPRQT